MLNRLLDAFTGYIVRLGWKRVAFRSMIIYTGYRMFKWIFPGQQPEPEEHQPIKFSLGDDESTFSAQYESLKMMMEEADEKEKRRSFYQEYEGVAPQY